MGLSHEHVGSKISTKIKIYILNRAELLITLCNEIPCINQKKIRRAPLKNLGRIYRVDYTEYPSNHVSGCRLHRRLLKFSYFHEINSFWNRKYLVLFLKELQPIVYQGGLYQKSMIWIHIAVQFWRCSFCGK